MALDRLSDIATFVRVVACGSLSAAARELDLTLAAVSKRLLRLEAGLGVRLLNRTTRQLSLTDEGREFHAHCLTLLDQVSRAEDAIASRREAVSGLVRVTASSAFCRRQIAPRLGRLLERFPLLRVELIATDDVVDIVRLGIDIAIRQAALPDSELIARPIASDRRILCASPAYIARRGAVQCPSDLQRHQCIVFGDPPITRWLLTRGHDSVELDIDWAIRVNAGDASHAAVLGGAGITLKSVWEVADDIAAGRLVELLPGWKSPARPIYAVCPSIRHRSPNVRAFINFLATELDVAQRTLAEL